MFLEKHGPKLLYLKLMETPRTPSNSHSAHNGPYANASIPWLDPPVDILPFCPNLRDLVLKPKWFTHDHEKMYGEVSIGPEVEVPRLSECWAHSAIERLMLTSFTVEIEGYGKDKKPDAMRGVLERFVRAHHAYVGPCLAQMTEAGLVGRKVECI
jgi:hypothetical protein